MADTQALVMSLAKSLPNPAQDYTLYLDNLFTKDWKWVQTEMTFPWSFPTHPDLFILAPSPTDPPEVSHILSAIIPASFPGLGNFWLRR